MKWLDSDLQETVEIEEVKSLALSGGIALGTSCIMASVARKPWKLGATRVPGDGKDVVRLAL